MNSKYEITVRMLKEVAKRDWSEIYVLFSGGRDSLAVTLLTLDALGEENFKVVFIDTGIATPGLIDYVRYITGSLGIELEVIYPLYDYFSLVLEKGFPTIRRRWCKEYLKIKPLRRFVEKLVKEPILFITGVRSSESWMKSKAKRLYYNEKVKAWAYAPLLDWNENDVKNYIRKHDIEENPLYRTFGKAYDCWCSPFKKPSDFALLAKHFPEFFMKFVDAESRLSNGGSGLFYSKKKVYFKDIWANPDKYLE